MKKIICFTLAVIISVSFTVSASAKNVGIEKLGDDVKCCNSGEIKTAVAEKDMVISDALIVRKSEVLIIPQGCRLTLKKGCKLYGTLFVSGGGALSVTGGTLDIRGSLVSEADVTIGKKARLYVSPRGSFTSKTKSVGLDSSCTIACLGECSVSNCTNKIKKVLCAKATGGVVIETYSGKTVGSEYICAEEASSLLRTVYNIDEKIPQDENYEYLVILMENGSAVTVGMVYERISDIGKAEIDSALRLSGQYGVTVSISEYPQLCHNGEVYFYNGVLSNQKIVGGKVISDDKAIDVDAVKADGTFLGGSIVDYNFNSPPDKELYVTGSDIPFDVYELESGEIVLIAAEPLQSGLYCHYLLIKG